MYLEFAGRAMHIMQQHIMSNILGETVYTLDLEGSQKKLAKIHKAMQYMERHK